MRDLLFLQHKRTQLTDELIDHISQLGLRVKLCVDSETALKWAKTRAFNALVVDGSFSLPHMLALANLLWQRSPDAPCWILDREDRYRLDPPKLRVHGFDVAIGESGVLELTQSVRELLNRSTFDRESFPILVVEDLDSPRDIICIFLESLGFPKVVGKASAKEALSLLESGELKFSCIVTDLQMPEISGKELIEIIRANPKLQHIPIIVLTAYGTVDKLVECLHVGASGFLVKPPKKEDMLRELSRAVRIVSGLESPRLASPNEAEYIRRLFESSSRP